MSLPLVRSSAAAAVGRTMQPWRRLLRDELLHRRPISSTAKEEVNALLEEIKETKICMVTRDTIIKTLHHSILGRQQILVQNVLRSWVVAAAAIAGYTWGYSRVAQHSAVGSFEPPTEHEERVD